MTLARVPELTGQLNLNSSAYLSLIKGDRIKRRTNQGESETEKERIRRVERAKKNRQISGTLIETPNAISPTESATLD